MLKIIYKKYSDTTELNKFLIKGTALYMVWRVFRKWMILHGEQTDFTQFAATLYLKVVGFLLRLFSFHPMIDYPNRSLWLEGGKSSIYIAYDCLGVNLFFIFSIFIIAYPGRFKIKWWFILVGFLIIFLLNSMRMAALAWIVSIWPDKMEFYHNFVFQGVIFFAIFGMWILYGFVDPKQKNPNSN